MSTARPASSVHTAGTPLAVPGPPSHAGCSHPHPPLTHSPAAPLAPTCPTAPRPARSAPTAPTAPATPPPRTTRARGSHQVGGVMGGGGGAVLERGGEGRPPVCLLLLLALLAGWQGWEARPHSGRQCLTSPHLCISTLLPCRLPPDRRHRLRHRPVPCWPGVLVGRGRQPHPLRPGHHLRRLLRAGPHQVGPHLRPTQG